jgi:Leucine-rich repeat (LRR) protein
MRVIAPRPLSAIRLIAPGFVLLLALSMTGCDQVQDIMGEREATDAVPADRSSATTPRTTTTPAQQTGQATPAPPNAEQLLAEFRSLNSLRVTDEALKRVADVPAAASQIVDLDLSGAPIGTGGLALLGKFPNLRTVNLSNIKLPAGGFAGFSSQSTFTQVELVNSTIDAAGLKSLSGVKSITRINLSGATAVNADGLTALSQIPQLVELDISRNSAIGSNVTGLLAQMPLVRLNAAQTSVNDAGLPNLGGIETLKDLSLSFCPITGVGFRKAFKNSQLTKLAVAETSFGESGLLAVRGMKSLEELNVYKCGLKPLNTVKRAFSSLPNLRVLHIGVNGVFDAAIGPWFGNCKNLEELNISGHKSMVTNAGLAGLVKLRNLKHLNCADTAVNAQGAVSLKARIPGLEVTTGDGRRQ